MRLCASMRDRVWSCAAIWDRCRTTSGRVWPPWPFVIMRHSAWECDTVCYRAWPSVTGCGRVPPYGSLWSRVWPFAIVSDIVLPCVTVCSLVTSYRTVCDCVWLCVAVCDIVWQCVIVGDHVRPCVSDVWPYYLRRSSTRDFATTATAVVAKSGILALTSSKIGNNIKETCSFKGNIFSINSICPCCLNTHISLSAQKYLQ